MTITAPAPAPPEEQRRASGFKRLYYGQTRFDFVRRRKIWFTISGLVILAGVISLGTRGLNFDIEFLGGTSWQVPANGVSVTQARTAISPAGFGGATITLLGTGSHETLQVEARLPSTGKGVSTAEVATVQRLLAHLTHHSSLNSVSIEQVGPTWGSQITQKAGIALIVFFILIAIYISLFFEWKMALAAIVAVAHDILVTVGIYSLTFFLVTPDTVVAFLTILGYSLYDTIVVFDRVRDNAKGSIGASGKLTITDLVNLSMNQTLARSINTSLVAIMPILAVLVLGADVLGATTLEYFGLALVIGLASGAYSSIFIASPIVAMLKEGEGRYTQIRMRLEARGSAKQLLSPEAVAGGLIEERDGRVGQRGGRRLRGATAGRIEEATATATAAARRSGPLRPRAAGPAPQGGNGNMKSEEMDGLSDVSEVAQVGTPPKRLGAGGGPPSKAGSSPNTPAARSAPVSHKQSSPQRPAPRPRKKRRR
ncbi:MAG: protein translocase subunit SecF [Acidimicrobiales bacterium]